MAPLDPYSTVFVEHVYLLVFIGTFIDGTALPFPGRLLLITAGSFASTGAINATAVTLAGMLGSSLGDHVWYLIGRLGGQKLFSIWCRLILGSNECVKNARDYFQRFGIMAVVVGRFVAGVRIFIAPLSISSGISYRRFLLFDLLGCLVWAGLFVMLGYTLGDRWIEFMGHFGGGEAILVLFLIALAGGVVFRLWRNSRYGSARTIL